jgi:2,4-diaminopentanoate dehydrogenase
MAGNKEGADAQPVRIGLCGLGSIGGAASRLLLDHRRGFDLVAAATKEPEALGKRLGEVVGAKNAGGPVVSDDLSGVLECEPQVVIYATGSFLRDTLEDIVACARAGASLVSPCEELAFPFHRAPEAAERIDAEARASGATILGSGVNPGFIFDSMLSLATGVCWDIEAIRGRRVVDVSGFGQNIHLRLGIGYTKDEFEDGHAEGRIAGHVGFPESIEMVCERLGVTLDGPVEESFEPLIADTSAPTRYGDIEAGRTEGFIQRAVGHVGGRQWIQLDLVLHLRPTERALEPSDTFEIDGLHPVRMTLSPGMDAIWATAAEMVNSIPAVLAAPPGLKSVKDLPASSAWLGDLRTGRFR